MTKILILLLLFFSNSFLYSQNITGEVKDRNGAGIENASILVWNSTQKEKLLGYYYTDSKGIFTIPFNSKNNIFIEISCINYGTFTEEISNSAKINVVLEKKEIILDEVIIKSEKPIRVKNDSTFYDPSKFLNGTERKVEDLLKKLPGITVNESTGEIKFKGKAIETVKLEDDDLFGSNYSVGTKHISVDMVEQVQAIENYSSNSLLKSIEDSDKVVINLKLKKHKTDFSGDVTMENGYEKKILTSNEITVLGINKNIKLFGFVTQANFGIDTNNLEPINEENNNSVLNVDYLTKKNLSETTGNSFLPAKRTTHNDYFYANNNLMYKISDKIKIKNNFYFFKDNYKMSDLNSVKYINNTDRTTENSYDRNPKYFRFDTKISYNTSKKSLLEEEVVFKTQSTNSQVTTLQNNSNFFQSNLNSNDIFIKSKLEFTLKIAEKKAFQFRSVFANNSIPQSLLSAPNNSFITGLSTSVSEQKSEFKKQIFENSATYLVSTTKMKSTFSLIYLNEKLPFTSQLSEDNFIVTNYLNDNSYNKSILSGNYSLSFKIGNFKLQPFLSFNKIEQKTSSLNEKDIVTPYSFLATYTIKKHSFYLNNELDFKTPTEDFLFANNVLLGNNSVKNNIISLNLIKTNRFSTSYKYDNLTKLFLLKLKFDYSQIQNSQIYNLSINPNFIIYTYFQSPTDIVSKNISLDIDKSFKKANISIKQNTTFNINNYQNAINNFEIRNNLEKSLTTNLFIISYFNYPINFESKFSFSTSSFTSNESNTMSRKSMNYIFRIIAKPFASTTFSFCQDYYKTDLESNDSFTLFDFNFHYKSKKYKWLNFNLYGKNLFNKTNYSQTSTNDYSTMVYQSQLIPRHFLASFSLDF